MRAYAASKAAISLAVGLFLTFWAPTHVIGAGIAALMTYSFALAAVLLITGFRIHRRWISIESIPMAAVAILIGVFSFLNLDAETTAAFKSLVVVWTLISAAFDFYQTRRLGIKSIAGRDSLISFGLAISLAAIFLIFDPEARAANGFFSAFLLLQGVHLAIAAASPNK